MKRSVPNLVRLVKFTRDALVGILSFARVVAWAIEHFRVQTMTFIVVLMVGSLRVPGNRVLGLDAMTDEVTY